jgi:hypothetical protein
MLADQDVEDDELDLIKNFGDDLVDLFIPVVIGRKGLDLAVVLGWREEEDHGKYLL